MRQAFYDRVNLLVDFDDTLSELCDKSQGLDLDHEKTAAIITAVKLVRSRKASLKIWVFDAPAKDVIDKVAGIGVHIFGENSEVRAGDVVSLIEAGEKDYDIFIIATEDELVRLAILDRGLEHLAAAGLFMYLSFYDYDRYDSLVTKRSQMARLEKKGFTAIELSYFFLAARGFGFPTPNPWKESLEYEAQSRCLFVFGSQRSGTSLLFQLLNAHDNILITYEANAYILKNCTSFIGNYNYQSRKLNRPIAKGHFLPPLSDPDLGLMEIYRRFLERYRFFGDKIAFGPRNAVYESPRATIAYAHITEMFPFARIILSSRRPMENIVAAHRILPNHPLPFLIDNWLSGIIKTIEMLCYNNRSVLCPMERIVDHDFRPLSALTGLNFREFSDIVKTSEITTSKQMAADYFKAQDARLLKLVKQAEHTYDDFLAHVDGESGRFKSQASREGLENAFAEFSMHYQTLREIAGWSS